MLCLMVRDRLVFLSRCSGPGGDGSLEIIFPSYDGRMHAFWLDKTEHGNWPYSIYKGSEGFYRFASEPAIADLDNDGHAEVIFGSWVEKGTHKTGKLHILNYHGAPLFEIDLPAAYGGPDWNGALAAPTLANIDADPDLELVLNTAHSGVVAYDLPGTADARILWGTGRGSYLRNGSPDPGSGAVTCPQCIGQAPIITNIIFPGSTDCECRAATSITIGPGVTVKAGASMTFISPTVTVLPGFHAEEGAVVLIQQQ